MLPFGSLISEGCIEAAVDLIKEGGGKHVDPALVELFLQEQPGILAIRKRFDESGV